MTQPYGEVALHSGHPGPEPPSPGPARPPIADDFIDAPPVTPELEWPPVGAYPGEPGWQPGDDQPTTAFDGQTQFIETGWRQAPPTEPWHARHERVGEWHHEPPEHLAFDHSPPAEAAPGATQARPPYAAPLLPVEAEPARRRSALWISMALVVTLLLCGGGATSAFLLLRSADTGKGAPDPATAVNRFLTAVYTQQDASAAGEVICREARDTRKLNGRIAQIKTYAAEYDDPSFRWNDPAVSAQTAKQATVAVQLTMSTDDEKQAQQNLTFTVVHKAGWLVCDITG